MNIGDITDEFCAFCLEGGFTDLDQMLAHITECEYQRQSSLLATDYNGNNTISNTTDTKKTPFYKRSDNSKNVLPEGLLACPKCLYRTREARYLERHMRRHEGRYSRDSSKGRCQCNVCGRTFASNQTRSVHTKKFHMTDQLRYKCNICGNRYIQQATLNRHLETCFFRSQSSHSTNSTNSLLVQRFIKKHCVA